jgi:3-hydroxyacyl-[acyl-carrier-protein] dehydratase
MRFLLVDRITDLESGLRATGLKNVTLSEDFFTHHFPANPLMPGALITECLVQLSDWLLRESSDFNCIAFPWRIELVKFHRLVRPGDQLRLEVQIIGRENGLFQIRGEASCQDQVAAFARFEMRMLPATDFHFPEEARNIYRMIRGMPEQ